jgi:hypothetical protein
MMELSIQNEQTLNRIRTLYLEGKRVKEIQEELGIVKGTWDNYFYLNKNAFRDFINACEIEYLKNLARKNLKEVAEMDTSNLDDVRYLKIKTDVSQFIAETADKENFSKKTEDNAEQRTPINIQVNTYKKIQNLKKRLAPPNKP